MMEAAPFRRWTRVVPDELYDLLDTPPAVLSTQHLRDEDWYLPSTHLNDEHDALTLTLTHK